MMAQSLDMLSKHLVLVGGGHSHIEVLRRFAATRPETARVTLVGLDRFTPYSGMFPGVVAGHYAYQEAHIDLKPLCAAAGVEFIEDRVIGLDPERRALRCASGLAISYDLLSINVGSTPRLDDIPGALEAGVPVRPISGFLVHWQALLDQVRAAAGPVRIGVIGTGAGGVEMVLAIQYRMQQELAAAKRDPAAVTFSLFGRSERVLSSFRPRVQARFERILRARGIELQAGAAVIGAAPGLLRCADGRVHRLDHMVFVTEASAAPWIRDSGLTLDAKGFIAVSLALQSLSHPTVFAAGDVASVIGAPCPKAGVFAVRQGPPLAGNLRRSLTGVPLLYLRPQRDALALIGLGNQSAVGIRGRLSLQGRLVWRWKRRIDRRFIRRYQTLAPERG